MKMLFVSDLLVLDVSEGVEVDVWRAWGVAIDGRRHDNLLASNICCCDGNITKYKVHNNNTSL